MAKQKKTPSRRSIAVTLTDRELLKLRQLAASADSRSVHLATAAIRLLLEDPAILARCCKADTTGKNNFITPLDNMSDM